MYMSQAKTGQGAMILHLTVYSGREEVKKRYWSGEKYVEKTGVKKGAVHVYIPRTTTGPVTCNGKLSVSEAIQEARQFRTFSVAGTVTKGFLGDATKYTGKSSGSDVGLIDLML